MSGSGVMFRKKIAREYRGGRKDEAPDGVNHWSTLRLIRAYHRLLLALLLEEQNVVQLSLTQVVSVTVQTTTSKDSRCCDTEPCCSYECIASKPCATEVSQGFWGVDETEKYRFHREKWWPESESNQRHADFQSAVGKKTFLNSSTYSAKDWVRHGCDKRLYFVLTPTGWSEPTVARRRDVV